MEGVSSIYSSACKRMNVSPVPEFINALIQNQKTAALQSKVPPLNDVDIRCIAEAIENLKEDANLKVLNLEENSFGLEGVQALMESLERNPHRIRELRLGRNNLKDTCAAVIGQTLARTSCGLKVLDLSENGLTRLAIPPVAAALQSIHCELVELSFHNNKIEGDAAAELVEAIKSNSSLKHLHFGFNVLRDTGVYSIARALPQMPRLVTLDLTANRIGPDGGEALASALCDPNCRLQRLNLQHNLLESRGIAAFDRVLRKNNSLIQLFLGFMSPTPEVGELILKALTQNRSLLLLDVLGWKLHQQRTLEVIKQIQDANGTFAALVTDACSAIIPQVQQGNKQREERGTHPVYVGADDREAYVATKSQKRFTRAQSRHSSRARSRSVHSEKSGRMSVTRVRKASHGGSGRPGSTASSHEYRRQPSHTVDEEIKTGGDSHEHKTQGGAGSMEKRHSLPANGSTAELLTMEEEKEVAGLLHELETKAECDAETKRVVRELVNSLCGKVQQQKREMQAVYSRIVNLERRRECTCTQRSQPGGDFAMSTPIHQQNYQRTNVVTSGALPSSSLQSVLHSQSMNVEGGFASHQQQNYSTRNYANSPFYEMEKGGPTITKTSGSTSMFPPPHSSPTGGQQASRSMSRGRYDLSNPERAVTPLVRPSEQHDLPPNISSRAIEESGNRCPKETSLQRSASVVNFASRLEPSPAPDRQPPRRKIAPSALIN